MLVVTALEIVLDSPYLDIQVPLNSENEVSLHDWMQKQYETHGVITSIIEECKVMPSNVM